MRAREFPLPFALARFRFFNLIRIRPKRVLEDSRQSALWALMKVFGAVGRAGDSEMKKNWDLGSRQLALPIVSPYGELLDSIASHGISDAGRFRHVNRAL